MRNIATLAILLSLVVAAFEGTGVTGAMPTIAAELGGLGAYAWVFSAFLVASTLGVLACGKLADAFGRRPVYAAGMGLFLAASAACGAARSIEQLVAFRVLQGLGAGAIQPIAMTISADLFNMRERAKIQALFTTVWGATNALGPLLGGFLVVHLSWRWVFYVNVPVGLLAVGLLFASFRDPPRVARGPSGAGGAVLAGLVAGLVLLSMEPASALHGAGVKLGLAASALAGAIVLVRQQRRTPSPLVAPELLRNTAVRAGLVGGLFAGALLYASTAYVPLWVSRQLGRDAITAGSALVPLLVGWSVGSTFGVHVLVQRGMRASVAGGFAVALAGALGLAFVVTQGLPIGYAFAALGVMGLGLGPAASTALIAPQSQARWDQRGMVTSAVYATRLLGGSLMVSALGSAHEAASGAPVTRFVGIAVVALLALGSLFMLSPGRLHEVDRGETESDAPAPSSPAAA